MKLTKSGMVDKRTKEGKEFYSPENQKRGRIGCLVIIIILIILYFCGVFR